jgi:hypothetical protein
VVVSGEQGAWNDPRRVLVRRRAVDHMLTCTAICR